MPAKTLFCLFSLVFLAPLSLRAEPAHSPNIPSEYTVQKGDFLWKISKNVWGEGKKWLFIYAFNHDKIKDPNLVYDGQKLAIPATLTPELIRKAHNLVVGLENVGGEPPRKAASHAARNENPGENAAAPAKTKGVPNPQENSNQTATGIVGSTTAPAETSGTNSHAVGWIVLLLVVVAGAVVMVLRMGKSDPPENQTPRPLSQYSPPAPSPNPAPTPVQASAPIPSPTPEEPAETFPHPTILAIALTAADAFAQERRWIEAAKAYRDILEKDPGNVEVGKKLIRVENQMRLKAAEIPPVAPAASPQTPAVPVEPPMHSGTVTSLSDYNKENVPPSQPETSNPPPSVPPPEDPQSTPPEINA